jgi:hypothetical protein
MNPVDRPLLPAPTGDRYEVWVDGQFRQSFPTRDMARMVARSLEGTVKDTK